MKAICAVCCVLRARRHRASQSKWCVVIVLHPIFRLSFFSFCLLKCVRVMDGSRCVERCGKQNSIRHNFIFNCNKMIYLQSLILEQIYVGGNKKSTDENWMRHGSISFPGFRTCASMNLSVIVCVCVCARIAMEMIRIHVYAYEWTNILVYILWLDLPVDLLKIRYQVCRRITKLETLYTYTDKCQFAFFSEFVHSGMGMQYSYLWNTQYIYVIYGFTVEIMLTFTHCTNMQKIFKW